MSKSFTTLKGIASSSLHCRQIYFTVSLFRRYLLTGCTALFFFFCFFIDIYNHPLQARFACFAHCIPYLQLSILKTDLSLVFIVACTSATRQCFGTHFLYDPFSPCSAFQYSFCPHDPSASFFL